MTAWEQHRSSSVSLTCFTKRDPSFSGSSRHFSSSPKKKLRREKYDNHRNQMAWTSPHCWDGRVCVMYVQVNILPMCPHLCLLLTRKPINATLNLCMFGLQYPLGLQLLWVTHPLGANFSVSSARTSSSPLPCHSLKVSVGRRSLGNNTKYPFIQSTVYRAIS